MCVCDVGRFVNPTRSSLSPSSAVFLGWLSLGRANQGLLCPPGASGEQGYGGDKYLLTSASSEMAHKASKE